MSQPQVSWGAPTDPWCCCLGLWQHRSVPGDLSTPGLSQVCKWLKWSSSECLIFLSAVSMQVSPGSLEQGEAPAQAVPKLDWAVPRWSRAGSRMLLPKCWHRGVPSAVPPWPHQSGNTYHRPCTAPRSVGEHMEHPNPEISWILG